MSLRIGLVFELLDRQPRRPGEPDCTWANIDKIAAAVGWAPKISFEEGVGRVLEGIDYWKDAPLWVPDSITSATGAWFEYLGKEHKS